MADAAIVESLNASQAEGVRVLHVDQPSPAARVGMESGDYLISINGHRIADVIDYWFHSADEKLKIVWRRGGPDGEERTASARKGYDERLGCEVEPFEIRRCSNACVFCFVHQNPIGVRRELFIKDEDYRLSFLYGNYITGTNLSPDDIARIIEYRLSPLYFSVHATNQELREELLVKRDIEPIVPLMKRLADAGIALHAQIVLCPGWNDGKAFEKTVNDLATLYPALESIAVVPVGLTRHRERLPNLQPVTPDYAAKFLVDCASVQRRIRKKISYPLVFPSDEFHLIAGEPPPAYDEYPEIPQLANGVGVVFRFYQNWNALLGTLPTVLPTARRVAALTSPLGAQVLERLAKDVNARVTNLDFQLLPTSNSLFGEGITVTGLIPGADFQRQIRENPGFDCYLVPENALRPWDQRFIDDLTLEELKSSTQAPVAVGADTAESLIEVMFSGLGLSAG